MQDRLNSSIKLVRNDSLRSLFGKFDKAFVLEINSDSYRNSMVLATDFLNYFPKVLKISQDFGKKIIIHYKCDHCSIYFLPKRIFAMNEISRNSFGFKNFLAGIQGFDWVKNVKVKRINKREIKITKGESNYLLKINKNLTEARLTIDDKTFKFLVKEKNGNLNMYDYSCPVCRSTGIENDNTLAEDILNKNLEEYYNLKNEYNESVNGFDQYTKYFIECINYHSNSNPKLEKYFLQELLIKKEDIFDSKEFDNT